MKIAIVGSRDYPKLNEVAAYICSLPVEGVTIISGGAKGVDAVAEEVAVSRGMKKEIYPADWEKYGKSAGYRRNQDIVDAADLVVAFWDGTSKGTRHSINLALATNTRLIVFRRAALTVGFATEFTFYNFPEAHS